MAIAPTFEPFNRENVFYDLETWEGMLRDAVKDNPRLAEDLARLLYRVVRELATGEEGRERVVNTMKLGVEWLYAHTEAHKLSFIAFLYNLEGRLALQDAPEEIMKL